MKKALELGKEYEFAGYRWVPVRINEEKQMAVMQSLGVTSGPWPGYSIPQFGNDYYYTQDISGMNISDYDDKTKTLMEQIKPVVSGDVGLYLSSYNDIEINAVLRKALAKAAAVGCHSLGASYSVAWLGSFYGNSSAWYVGSSGSVGSICGQGNSCVVAPAFNLDLSKIKIEGSEIKIKVLSASKDNTVKTEKYEGWTIMTNRPNGLCDLVTRKLEFGTFGDAYKFKRDIQVFLNEGVNEQKGIYYLTINGMSPFKLSDRDSTIILRTHINDDNFHSLINEANDVLHTMLTQMHEYIMEMIGQLPEI